ncbi:MAG TPA: serine hydrolase domain-containing protein [Candidatus Dormibacteraeota bacterium]|nr:serine hydrolase domain-containing protein [Candidatus Dormibacteraeota bacterium]
MSTSLPRTVAAVERGMQQGLHLGAQAHVALGGEPVADLALGEARAGVPMTGDRMIIWWSMTKATVAVSVARLWERGEVALDDPVARYVPEFGVHGKDRITIRHLLTHTGGFRAGDQVRSTAPDPSDWWAETVAGICAVEPEPGWVPGRRAGYHLSCGMTMLGEIVRRVDGRTYDRFVREEVFEPLGMVDCWVGMPADRVAGYADRVGTMHDSSQGAAVPRSELDTPAALVRCSPGGGGRGPMRQLARLYEMLRRHGELDGVRLLTPQTVEAITARHRVGLYDHTFNVVTDWALGFNVDGGSTGPHCSPRTFGHGGAQSSLAFCDPDHGIVAAIQTNGMCGNERHYQRLHELSRLLYVDLGLAGEDDPGRQKALPRMAGLATA